MELSDTIFNFILNAARAEEKDKYRIKTEADNKAKDKTEATSPYGFWTEKKAGDLLEGCFRKIKHHRERQSFYEEEFKKAEAELKEKGISIQLEDNGDFVGHLSSGNISSNASFVPKVDQVLLSAVKEKKRKVKEHNDKASQYEKFARAFSCDPERLIKLDIENITFFGLGVISKEQ